MRQAGQQRRVGQLHARAGFSPEPGVDIAQHERAVALHAPEAQREHVVNHAAPRQLRAQNAA